MTVLLTKNYRNSKIKYDHGSLTNANADAWETTLSHLTCRHSRSTAEAFKA